MTIPKLYDYVLPKKEELPENKVSWVFEPQRAALLIHDMQEYFLSFWREESQLVEQLIKKISQLRRFCKKQGIPIFYTAQSDKQSDEERGLLNDMWGKGLTQYPTQQKVVSALTPDSEDVVLTKWRYSAFYRSCLKKELQQRGRDQLIICGVYAHVGCMVTAIDAFTQNIKPFMVADALADFSRQNHLMALQYTAGCCGRVVMLSELLQETMTLDRLRQQVLPLLDQGSEDISNDENLIDYGLDSVKMMELATRWRKVKEDIDFVTLAKSPTLNSWWSLFSTESGQHGRQ